MNLHNNEAGRKVESFFFVFQSSSSVYKICHDNVGADVMKVSQGICNCVCVCMKEIEREAGEEVHRRDDVMLTNGSNR